MGRVKIDRQVTESKSIKARIKIERDRQLRIGV